ncbi:MAG: 1-acyl-sn-glycerol-3-phosphate acyltransferase [Gammaproteobacteria bacterium]|nr:1-acyl-sn-glycerol-3-phosphate acyltransferase [Gammaproteobacteria bacterium]
MRETLKEPHIIDVLIEERALRMREHPLLWKLVRKVCNRVLGYKKAVGMADDISLMNGIEVFDYFSDLLELDMHVKGPENIPKTGAVMITPNHPAGIADGVAIYEVLKQVREDICFVANRDALRVAPAMSDTILPVEWRESERTIQKQRETVRAIIKALKEERAVVVFPSGRLARPTLQGLKERPWHGTALSFADKYQIPVVPIHIKGRNTAFYYATWYINTELKDMTLFRELLNKKGQTYHITVGESFTVDGDVNECTRQLQNYVLNDLKKGKTHFTQTSTS